MKMKKLLLSSVLATGFALNANCIDEKYNNDINTWYLKKSIVASVTGISAAGLFYLASGKSFVNIGLGLVFGFLCGHYYMNSEKLLNIMKNEDNNNSIKNIEQQNNLNKTLYEIQNLKEQNKNLTEEINSNVNEKNNIIKDLESQIEGLKEQNKKLVSEIEDLKKSDTLNQQIEELEEKNNIIKDLEDEIERIKENQRNIMKEFKLQYLTRL